MYDNDTGHVVNFGEASTDEQCFAAIYRTFDGPAPSSIVGYPYEISECF